MEEKRLLEEIRDLQKEHLEQFKLFFSEFNAQTKARVGEIKKSIELQELAIKRQQSNWKLYKVIVACALVAIVVILFVVFNLLGRL